MRIDDLSEIEGNQFQDFDKAPEGWHNLTVVSCKEGTNHNGTPFFEFDIESETSGHSFKEWVYITPKSLPNVKAKLLMLSFTIPPGAFNVEPESLIGRKFMGLIKLESKFSKKHNEEREYAQIKLWDKPNAHPPVAAKNSFEGTTGGVDEDIPF